MNQMINMAILATMVMSCGVNSDYLLSTEDETKKHLRLAVISDEDSNNQMRLFIAANHDDWDVVEYCINCDSGSEEWSSTLEITGRENIRYSEKIDSLKVNDKISLRLVKDSEVIQTRNVQWVAKDEDSDDSDIDNEQESQCHKADPFTCEVELAVHKYTNEYRKKHGLNETVFHKRLGFVSRDWSEKQYNRGRIGHEGFTGERIKVYRSEFGEYDARMSGENVAMSSGVSLSTADRVGKYFADMWYNSPGHRANMLTPSQRTHGPGIYIKGRSVYATQIFGR